MGVTQELAEFVTSTDYDALPSNVAHEAKRAIINVMGVALYSAKDPSLQALTGMFEAEGGKQRAGIWGTNVRTTMAHAALANGYTSHLEDYDDTHFPTVMHPTAPTLPAAFAIGEEAGASGRDLITAVALGIEVCCRICLSVHPWHYDAGWHITGTMGVFGAVIGAGRMAGIDAGCLVTAMGIAGTQAAGVREAFGTMTKAMHAGRAAQAGVVSTLLAQRGFTAAPAILEGRRGVAEVMSGEYDLSRATDAIGERWEIFNNGLKPYSCGVVSHPAIDAAVALRSRPGFDADAVERIEAFVNPLVPELMGRAEPQVGLEGKFSVQHCIAAGLIDGEAHPAQFADAKVQDERLTAIRRKIQLTVEQNTAEDACRLRITMKDGSVLEETVDHATGSPENPLSDELLAGKFLTLATATLGESGARDVLDRLWHLDDAHSLAGLLS